MRTGIVVIGRNEGARLRTCLSSVVGRGDPLVYVDSGSTDGSPAMARAMGIDVLELDPARPFSAARARNEGFARLTHAHPEVERVQFVDGDCELFPGWIERAEAVLGARPEVVVVTGRLRERFADASVYNRLCALEWDQEPGEVRSCGGIFVIRAAAFRAVGGFRDHVVAGEEPELCLRLRRAGGVVFQLADDMAWHDSAMLRFRQWWRRTRRGGQAFAQGSTLHGGPGGLYVREHRSALLWGLAVPVLTLALALATRGLGLAFLAVYPLQAMRVAGKVRTRGWSARDARLYGAFTVLAKFPELQGALGFHWRRLRGRPVGLIEHKAAASSAS